MQEHGLEEEAQRALHAHLRQRFYVSEPTTPSPAVYARRGTGGNQVGAAASADPPEAAAREVQGGHAARGGGLVEICQPHTPLGAGEQRPFSSSSSMPLIAVAAGPTSARLHAPK
jgi:hypothetical protein